MNAYSDSLRHSSSHPFHSSFHLQHTHTHTLLHLLVLTHSTICTDVCVCVPSHTHYTHIRTRVFFISLFPSIFQCKSRKREKEREREREREREELFKQKILPAYPHISRKEPVQARSDVKYLRANLQK
jgi:hypothetical protein